MTAPPPGSLPFPPPAPHPAPTTCPPGRCFASDLCPDGPAWPANQRTLQGRGHETLSKHPSRRPTSLGSLQPRVRSGPVRPAPPHAEALAVRWQRGFCCYLQPRPFPRLSNPAALSGGGVVMGLSPLKWRPLPAPCSRSAITSGVCAWRPAAAEWRLYGVGFLGAYPRFSGTAAVV